MFGWDFMLYAEKRVCDKNSTLGSVLPLAMLNLLFLSKFRVLCCQEFIPSLSSSSLQVWWVQCVGVGAWNDWKKRPRENWDNIISLISLQFCIFDLWINVFFSDSGVERKVVDKKCWRKSGPELISRLRRKQEATLLRRRLLPSQSRMRHKIWNIFHPGCFPTESFLDSVCEWFPSVFLL